MKISTALDAFVLPVSQKSNTVELFMHYSFLELNVNIFFLVWALNRV